MNAKWYSLSQGSAMGDTIRTNREIIVAFQYLKGPTRMLEKDFSQGQVVTGDRTRTNQNRVGLELGKSSSV